MGVGSDVVTTGKIPRCSQDVFFRILDNVHPVVFILDSDTTIVYANEAYTKAFGVPVHKGLGRRLDEIEPKALCIDVLRTGKSVQNRVSYLHSVGVDVIGQTFPLFEGRNITGCITVLHTISEVMCANGESRLSKGGLNYLHEESNQYERQLPGPFLECIGRNSRLQDTLYLAAKVATTDSTVLIRGESGVGKEVLARAIHKSSGRKNRSLIKVDCATIPEQLLESELFGFEGGSFTGARKVENWANSNLLMVVPSSWMRSVS